jgi:hypothetical protein
MASRDTKAWTAPEMAKPRTRAHSVSQNMWVDGDPAAGMAIKDRPLRSYKRIYGNVQALNPGRWLTLGADLVSSTP